MTRGRKKDLTIPPTRALVQQRDYRARKAHYIADLEERVRKAEAENVQLRKDLEVARAGHSLPASLLSPQVAEAYRDLMHNLSLASSSLTRFQHLAFTEPAHTTTLPSPHLRPLPEPSGRARPASFPSPTPSPPFPHPALQPPNRAIVPALNTSLPAPFPHNTSHSSGRKRLYREDSPEPHAPSNFGRSTSPRPENATQSLSPESECCGGFLDCQDLVEEDEGSDDMDDYPTQLSIMRSTSGRSSYTREDRSPSSS